MSSPSSSISCCCWMELPIQVSFDKHMRTFFPEGTNDLPKIPVELWGKTGDQQVAAVAPYFTDGRNIIRGKHVDGYPFLGICVSIGESVKEKAILVIAPNPFGNWYVYASEPIQLGSFSNIQADTPASASIIQWLKDILNGKERFSLKCEWFPKPHLIEVNDGAKVVLWQD